MEELRRLEHVQKTLSSMESRAFVSSSYNQDGDSNRFLANLILFLTKPCGNLSMGDKCRLASEFIPKIPCFVEEETGLFDSRFPIPMETGRVGDGKDVAMVGLDAMRRANSTLEDFCRSYFMFHGMDVKRPQAIFEYLPVLSFTESYIYEIDTLNEKIVNLPNRRGAVLESGYEKKEANQSWTSKFMDVFNDPFGPLAYQLECHGLLTERIMEEFKCGEEYWALERKLCSALANQKQIAVHNVMRAIHLKSFDYRVLNLLLYQLRGEKVNDLHMEFLSISEFLVEVSDDLFDYEDDVIENNFNILRLFARIYGPSGAPAMLAKYITEAEEKYDRLLKTLDPQLSLNYQQRCEEATKEGGNISGYPLGTWSIPPVILNEELYRSKWSNAG